MVVLYAPYILLLPWSWKEKSHKRGKELLFQIIFKINLLRTGMLLELHIVLLSMLLERENDFSLSSLEFVLLKDTLNSFLQSSSQFREFLFKFISGLLR